MAYHIPFITGSQGATLANEHFPDSPFVRVSYERIAKFRPKLPVGSKLWLDACVDGLDDLAPRRSQPNRENSWYECLRHFEHFDDVGSSEFQEKPVPAVVSKFVSSVLTKCSQEKPDWISVPQLPHEDTPERKRLNRLLAKASGDWRSATRYAGTLILPIIFTHPSQTTKGRTPRIAHIAKCYAESGALGAWVVDSSLNDDSGSDTLSSEKLPGLVSMHEELKRKIDSRIWIGGPYWGFNLILWAKGLVDYPAVGVGSGFQYVISGRPASGSAQPRLPLPPLRRRARVGPDLRRWLEGAFAKVPPSHPAHAAFASAKKSYTELEAVARRQIAAFYKGWYDSIAQHPPATRSMALYQDLSSAFALGRTLLKSLPLPPAEAPGRDPGSVAQQLMLSCL